MCQQSHTGSFASKCDAAGKVQTTRAAMQSRGRATHTSCIQEHIGSTHSSTAAAGFAGLRLNMLAMDGCLRSLNLRMHAEDRAQGGCLAGASRSFSSAQQPHAEHKSSLADSQAVKDCTKAC